MHIYAITNTVNSKIYIGQTCQKLDRYLRSDVTRALLHGEDRKPHLYNAIRKYGEAAFVIRLLVEALDKEQADKMEQFFIRTLETQNKEIGYNIAAGGGGSFGYHRVISDEQKEKLRIAGLGRVQSETTRAKIAAANSGKPKSAEHRAKLSKAKMGIKTGPFSEEHRAPERPGSCLLWIRGLPYRQTVDVAPKTERGKREWAEMLELRAKGGI